MGEAFPDVAIPPPGTNAFYVREEALSFDRFRGRTIIDNRYPDTTVLDDPIDTSGLFVQCRFGVDASGHDLICLNPVWLAGAPTLWFVALPEHGQPRPAISLVGFATEHFPVGTVITDPEFFTLPLRSEEQVGAIRWWYEDGIVDQVFIAEAWRRRHLGTAFTYAASAWQALHGKCSNLRSDGRRTELGKHLDAGTQFPNRFAPITKISRPMDLPAEA